MRKQIAALIGDYYHKEAVIREGIICILRDSDFDLKFVVEPEDLEWESLKQYDLILISKAGYMDPKEPNRYWFREEQENLLRKYVQEGGAILNLHSGLASYPTKGIYRELMKGHFIHHPPEHPVICIEPVEEKHPITMGIRPFEIVDEQYFVECDENTTQLLVGTSAEFGATSAGWAHTMGKGRICCITPGHNKTVYENPMMKQLVINAVQWCTERKES